MEVLFAYMPKIFKWPLRRMWPIAFESIISVLWAYVMFGIFVLYFYGLLFSPSGANGPFSRCCRNGTA